MSEDDNISSLTHFDRHDAVAAEKLTVKDRFRKNENILIDRSAVGFVWSVLVIGKIPLEDGFDENRKL
ncbi:hypothetical protein ANCCAN_03362 [Ancylostoma caninum]|uniref:Uncharacterized protein n=1 Tax=Ancylostoma caninum TaxID=29170 RepID=A0A368H405_ANCCA|nr:hypothetical protein ANCCAN_03362 [Ancylostoma caninum]